MKKKKKMSTSNKVILASVISTSLLTLVAVIMQFTIKEELNPTLIECFFAYWAIELGSLAAIKRKKLSTGYVSEEEVEDEDYCEEEDE